MKNISWFLTCTLLLFLGCKKEDLTVPPSSSISTSRYEASCSETGSSQGVIYGSILVSANTSVATISFQNMCVEGFNIQSSLNNGDEIIISPQKYYPDPTNHNVFTHFSGKGSYSQNEIHLSLDVIKHHGNGPPDFLTIVIEAVKI
jgi:hypothetical protein